VDVVAFVDDFFRARAARRDSLGPSGTDERCTLVTRDDNVRCSSLKVERALDATHKAIADTRAATGGNNESRMRSQ
jgi:hypothetical protein